MVEKKLNPRDSVFLFDQSEDADLSVACWKETLDLCGVIIPESFEGTSIGFKGSLGGTTYYDVWWDGAIIAITVAQPCVIMLDPIWFSGLRYLKMTSNNVVMADRTCTPIWRLF